MIALGHQTIIELYNADLKKLSSSKIVEQIFKKAAKESNSTVLWSYFHPFEPQGVSGVIIIAESHFTIHTWPEHGYAAIDIFVCSDVVVVKKAIDVFKREFETEEAVVTGELNRGIISTNGMAMQRPMSINQPELYTMSLKAKYNELNASAISITVNLHDVKDLFGSEKFNLYIDKLNSAYDFDLTPDFNLNDLNKDENDSLNYNYSGERGTLSVHFDPQKDHIYLDIFSYSFIEPREMSENALYFFNGKNHSFEFSFRQ